MWEGEIKKQSDQNAREYLWVGTAMPRKSRKYCILCSQKRVIPFVEWVVPSMLSVVQAVFYGVHVPSRTQFAQKLRLPDLHCVHLSKDWLPIRIVAVKYRASVRTPVLSRCYATIQLKVESTRQAKQHTGSDGCNRRVDGLISKVANWVLAQRHDSTKHLLVGSVAHALKVQKLNSAVQTVRGRTVYVARELLGHSHCMCLIKFVEFVPQRLDRRVKE